VHTVQAGEGNAEILRGQEAGEQAMKRRTLKALRPRKQPEHHHNVYVVLLESAAGKNRKVRAANPKRDPKGRASMSG